jgi:hypothetical protein
VEGSHVPPDHCVTVAPSKHAGEGGWLQLTPAHRFTHAPFSQTGAALPQPPHAAPPAPHWLPDCCATGTQVLPLQQPAQFDGLQLGEAVTQLPWRHWVPA